VTPTRARLALPETSALAEVVAPGLNARPKRLPPWLLYDSAGSDLFEEITRLPEYYPTRTERGILEAHAGRMLDVAGAPRTVIELGAGSSVKTRILLQAIVERQWSARYVPVDVSASALEEAAGPLRAAFPTVLVAPRVARYPEELGFLGQLPGPRLVLFLGSSLGNHEPAAATSLLREVRRNLAAGDALLLGADLPKPAELLVPAYDDAARVTARFNKNLLVRINRELGGGFDTRAFRHVARWNRTASRVELYLQSLTAQVVRIADLDLDVHFQAGELLHTENSYKWRTPVLRRILTRAGFTPTRMFQDARRWFALHVAHAGPLPAVSARGR
jgi:L-histidine Nalpha-methyltransferase